MIPGLPKRIRDLRAALGVSQSRFGELVGVSQPTVSRWEKGLDMPEDENIDRMADLAGITAAAFRHGPEEVNDLLTVPVVGYIGAGEAVMLVGGEVGELDRVKRPPGISAGNLVAVIIRGDSMRPLRAGWKVYYRRLQDGVPHDCINQLCVIELTDGSMYIKELRRGRKAARYDLISWAANTDVMEDQRVIWAAKVEAILP